MGIIDMDFVVCIAFIRTWVDVFSKRIIQVPIKQIDKVITL